MSGLTFMRCVYGARAIAIAIGVGTSLTSNIHAAKCQTETVLYTFCSQQNCTDGGEPAAALTRVGGRLYGTTLEGGGGGCANGDGGCGTVFSVNRSTGVEKVLYSFCLQQGCTDGMYPASNVIDVNGTLYGTTEYGGVFGFGTVFTLDPNTGVEMVLHSFSSGSDGAEPLAGLIDLNGTLYGTTEYGGDNDHGTVFSLDPNTGIATVLHSFDVADGSSPYAGLIDMNGMLYGTTSSGGSNGCGAVFSFDPTTDTEAVLYSFCRQQGGADGVNPRASVVSVGSKLYGTTAYGGAYGLGTVFSLNLKTGVEKVVYSFCVTDYPCTDGSDPNGIIYRNGTLYGTTVTGGSGNNCVGGGGAGTVFSLSPITGMETVLYSFGQLPNCADGDLPDTSLTYVRGTLYGATSDGGTGASGGVVFALTP